MRLNRLADDMLKLENSTIYLQTSHADAFFLHQPFDRAVLTMYPSGSNDLGFQQLSAHRATILLKKGTVFA
jgi:hypothetical protein